MATLFESAEDRLKDLSRTVTQSAFPRLRPLVKESVNIVAPVQRRLMHLDRRGKVMLAAGSSIFATGTMTLAVMLWLRRNRRQWVIEETIIGD